MRKYLIPEEGTFYKANLHCHSTVSDGSLTPEEIKKAYKEKGYSIVAFTDHNILLPHKDLDDDKFITLNGMELDISEGQNGIEKSEYNKTCHICFIALSPDNHEIFCYHREKYLYGDSGRWRNQLKFDENVPDYERRYTAECINEMIKTGREKGFFVTYNHPVWSMEFYPDYMSYHGMHAMEIVNSNCAFGGYPEYDELQYDDILRGGERIFCTATDDNHGMEDMFGGFTMIKAKELKYEAITDALLKGNFYASEGPRIKNLWFEDGKIFIECSNAVEIALTTKYRRAKKFTGEALTKAEFEVKDTDGYVRIKVTDKNGKRANTNAYFTDELFTE